MDSFLHVGPSYFTIVIITEEIGGLKGSVTDEKGEERDGKGREWLGIALKKWEGMGKAGSG